MNKITEIAKKIVTGFMAVALAFVIAGTVNSPNSRVNDNDKGNNFLGYACKATYRPETHR